MWVLILTMLPTSPQGVGSVAMHAFTTKASCQSAGDAWIKSVRDRNEIHYVRLTAVCSEGGAK